MKFLNSIIIIFLICFLNSSTFAQKASDYIAGNPTFVLTFNPEKIDSKVDLDQLLQMDFFKSFVKEMATDINYDTQETLTDAIKNPSQYGMDFKSSSYFYADISENASFFTYVFNLSDGQKFTQFFNEHIKDSSKPINIVNDFKTMTMGGEDSYMIWNDHVVMLTNGEVEYDYVDFSEEEFLTIDSLRSATVNNHINELAYQFASSNVERRFMAHNSKSDMHLWLDYAYISNMREEVGADLMKEIPYGMGGFFENLLTMYDDTYMSMAMNFDDGAININNKTYVNDKILELWRGAMDTNMNKKFSKYIKGNNLLGLFSFAYSVENTAKGLKNMMYEEMDKSEEMGGMATSLMDVIGIAIDEEALYNLFRGDMVFAITGMRVFEKEMIVTEYDQDFNRVEVQKMVAQELPEFTMMMSYGNEKDLNKLIRLGKRASVIEQRGSYYAINLPGNPMDLYLATHKGILFFSNDRDLITNKLSSGFPRKKRMSKQQCKMLKENAQVFLWDIPQTLNIIDGMEASLGFSGDQMLNMTKETFENVTITSSKTVGNTLDTQMSLNLRNKEINALEEIFNYFNDLYIVEMGGRKM